MWHKYAPTSPYPKTPQKAFLEVGKAITTPWWGLYTLSDQECIIWGTQFSFQKLSKPPERRLNEEQVNGDFIQPFCLATAKDEESAKSPMGSKEKRVSNANSFKTKKRIILYPMYRKERRYCSNSQSTTKCLTRDEKEGSLGGSCWRSLQQTFDCQHYCNKMGLVSLPNILSIVVWIMYFRDEKSRNRGKTCRSTRLIQLCIWL